MSNNSEYVYTNTLDSSFNNNNNKRIMRKKIVSNSLNPHILWDTSLRDFLKIFSMSNNSEYLNTNTLDGIAK